jgi:Protein of unknown function (DUF2490)
MIRKLIKMRMRIRIWCSVLLAIYLPISATAQKRDFGIWYGVSADKKLTDKIDIRLSTCIRTFENAAKIEEAFLEGGLAYSFSKYFAIGGSYRLTENIENNNSYYFRHKWFVDFKGNLPVSDFSFSWRFRFQTRIKTFIVDAKDKFPDYTGLIKLKALYKTPSFPVHPYLYSESFCPMFSDNTRMIGKNRLAAGVEFSISKRYSIAAEYIFQRIYLPHISDINIISINYNIEL